MPATVDMDMYRYILVRSFAGSVFAMRNLSVNLTPVPINDTMRHTVSVGVDACIRRATQ